MKLVFTELKYNIIKRAFQIRRARFFYTGSCFSKRIKEYKRISTINTQTIDNPHVTSVNNGTHAKIKATNAVKFPENPLIGWLPTKRAAPFNEFS